MPKGAQLRQGGRELESIEEVGWFLRLSPAERYKAMVEASAFVEKLKRASKATALGKEVAEREDYRPFASVQVIEPP